MTIAMMIEMLAGKSAALHGLVHDATPFKFSEDDDAIDHFAKQLVSYFYIVKRRDCSSVKRKYCNLNKWFCDEVYVLLFPTFYGSGI